MSFINPLITPQFLNAILAQYTLNPRGIHGIPHWWQVEKNALEIAETENIESPVFSLFALFHDSQRLNDGRDPDHGQRGAALAKELHGTWFELTATELEQLCYACENHTHQTHHPDPVIGICWDADRLDLPRVGIIPKTHFLNTTTAKAKLQ